MKIGVDIDGVVYNFVADLRDYLIEEHGTLPDSLPEPTQWEVWNSWGMSREDFDGIMADGIREGILFNRGSDYAYPGSIDALRAVKAAGHSIHFVTARNPLVLGATQSWLRESGFPLDSLTFSVDKTVMPVDLFIEDNLDNARSLRAVGINTFIMDRPWNQGPGFDGHRITEWEIVPDLVAVTERKSAVPDGLDHSHERTSDTGGSKGVKPERMSLIPHEPLLPIARVYTHGERKYGPHNWRKGYPWSWSIDALERHIGAFKMGFNLDEESGEPHLAHAAFHIFALLTWMRDPAYDAHDDRYRVEDGP